MLSSRFLMHRYGTEWRWMRGPGGFVVFYRKSRKVLWTWPRRHNFSGRCNQFETDLPDSCKSYLHLSAVNAAVTYWSRCTAAGARNTWEAVLLCSATTVHKIQLGRSPRSLRDLLTLAPGRPSVRSSGRGDFIVPRTSRKFGDRVFSVAAPWVWNRLPTEMRQLRSTPLFKRKLKTFFIYCWAPELNCKLNYIMRPRSTV